MTLNVFEAMESIRAIPAMESLGPPLAAVPRPSRLSTCD
jgi:hypothetical protein